MLRPEKISATSSLLPHDLLTLRVMRDNQSLHHCCPRKGKIGAYVAPNYHTNTIPNGQFFSSLLHGCRESLMQISFLFIPFEPLFIRVFLTASRAEKQKNHRWYPVDQLLSVVYLSVWLIMESVCVQWWSWLLWFLSVSESLISSFSCARWRTMSHRSGEPDYPCYQSSIQDISSHRTDDSFYRFYDYYFCHDFDATWKDIFIHN